MVFFLFPWDFPGIPNFLPDILFKHIAIFAKCQAIFTMKFAKNCVIMVDVNKKIPLCGLALSDLYNMYKKGIGILWNPKKKEGEPSDD
ncbi:MAG: hypothetical protein ACI4PH_03860 [Faecousia sp.]